MAESEAKSQPTESEATSLPTETETKTPPTESEVKTPPTKLAQAYAKELKYLDLVEVVATYVIGWFSAIYAYAKTNSGPLKPAIQTAEDIVRPVVEPVYKKFRPIPFKLLKFVDCKVGELITEVDHHVPSFIKQASNQTRAIASEIQQAGLVETAINVLKTVCTKYEPVAKKYYSKYEQVAEQYAVVAWKSLNRLPLFPQVAHLVMPTAAYWSQTYNKILAYFADKGYTVFYYMPLIPVERIAKVFQGA